MKQAVIRWLILVVGVWAILGVTKHQISQKIIVFDFGGVVAYTDKEALANVLAKELHIAVRDAEKVLEHMRQFHHQGLSPREFWRVYRKTKPLPDGWEDRWEMVRITGAHQEVPGMKSLLKELKHRGYRLALLSNVTKERSVALRQCGMYKLFDACLLSCDIGAKKPEPAAYQALLDVVKLFPSQCLFIDDKEQNIAVARQMGFDVILFTDADALRQALKERSIL